VLVTEESGAAEELDKLAMSLGIGLNGLDLFLVGDGSGTTIDKPCGWFVWAHDRISNTVKKYFGGTNSGTNNYAELANFVHAMWAYHARLFKTPPQDKVDIWVVIVSDSELTVRCGNRVYERKANTPLWAVFDHLESLGYKFTWHHVLRNSNPFNTEADRVAGMVRLKLTELT
jgi:ribonuclease HI